MSCHVCVRAGGIDTAPIIQIPLLMLLLVVVGDDTRKSALDKPSPGSIILFGKPCSGRRLKAALAAKVAAVGTIAVTLA